MGHAERVFRGKHGKWLVLAVYAVVALACFWQVLDAYFLSDDFILLTAVKKGGPFVPWPIGSAQFVRPVPLLWLWTGIYVFGANPLGFHVFNVLLLILDAIFIHAIVLEWFRTDRTATVRRAAFLAGLLFVVWPTHAE